MFRTGVFRLMFAWACAPALVNKTARMAAAKITVLRNERQDFNAKALLWFIITLLFLKSAGQTAVWDAFVTAALLRLYLEYNYPVTRCHRAADSISLLITSHYHPIMGRIKITK
jgi:hypothetical protein